MHIFKSTGKTQKKIMKNNEYFLKILQLYYDYITIIFSLISVIA